MRWLLVVVVRSLVSNTHLCHLNLLGIGLLMLGALVLMVLRVPMAEVIVVSWGDAIDQAFIDATVLCEPLLFVCVLEEPDLETLGEDENESEDGDPDRQLIVNHCLISVPSWLAIKPLIQSNIG